PTVTDDADVVTFHARGEGLAEWQSFIHAKSKQNRNGSREQNAPRSHHNSGFDQTTPHTTDVWRPGKGLERRGPLLPRSGRAIPGSIPHGAVPCAHRRSAGGGAAHGGDRGVRFVLGAPAHGR